MWKPFKANWHSNQRRREWLPSASAFKRPERGHIAQSSGRLLPLRPAYARLSVRARFL